MKAARRSEAQIVIALNEAEEGSAPIDVFWAQRRYADNDDDQFNSLGSITAEVFHLARQPKVT